ncbi:MAG: hypothetical protein WBF83_09330 [Moheibacter sp.]
MHIKILILIAFGLFSKTFAQDIQFREDIDKDSLLTVSLQNFPEDYQKDFLEIYKTGNEGEKSFLLFMLSLPRSSKIELVENYEKNQTKIENLISEYLKMIPKNYVIDIEFEPENKIFTIPEQITIKIFKIKDEDEKDDESNEVQRSDNLKIISINRDLRWGSEELLTVLNSIDWTNETLLNLKKLLEEANCVSIKNGEIINVGFARSGMGKYYYNFFKNSLNNNQIKQYNDGCNYIYYKNNVVLEYGGGAIGPQCFEKD